MRILLLPMIVMLAACVPLRSYHDGPIPFLENVDECQKIAKAPCLEVHALEFSDRGNFLKYGQLDSLKKRIVDIDENHGSSGNVIVYVHGWHHNAAAGDRDLGQFIDRLTTLAQLEGFKEKPTIGVYAGWRGESVSIPLVNVSTYYGRKRTAEIVGRTGLRMATLQLEAEVRRRQGKFVLIGHSFGTNAVLSAVQGDLIGRALAGSACQEHRDVPTLMPTRFEICMRSARFGHGVYLFNPAIEANAFSPLRAGISGMSFNDQQPKLLHVLATRAERKARFAFGGAQRVLNTFWAADRQVPLSAPCQGDECHDEVQLMTTTMGQYAPFWTGSITANHEATSVATWRFQHIKNGCHSLLLPADVDVIGRGLGRKSISAGQPGFEDQADWCRLRSTSIPPDWVPFEIQRHIPAQFSDPIQVTIADWDIDNGNSRQTRFMKDHNAQLCPVPLAYIAAAVMENEKHIRSVEGKPGGDDSSLDAREGASTATQTPSAMTGEASPPEFADCSTTFDFGRCFAFYRSEFKKTQSDHDKKRCSELARVDVPAG